MINMLTVLGAGALFALVYKVCNLLARLFVTPSMDVLFIDKGIV